MKIYFGLYENKIVTCSIKSLDLNLLKPSFLTNFFNKKKLFSIVENFVSYSLFKLIDAVIPLIIIPYLIIVVGSEKYGIYAFGFALTFYFINIIQYGFTLSGVRLIALNRDDKKDLNNYFNQIFSTQFYLSFLALTILLLLVLFIPMFREYYMMYLFFCILMIGEFLTPIWLFLGLEKMRFITVVNFVSKLTFAVFTFTLINKESDFIYIALYQSIGYIISGITAQLIIRYKLGIVFKLSSIKSVILMLKDGLSAFLTLISPMMYTNTSIFLVGIFGIPQYVSYMQIGTKFSGAFSVLNTILTSVFYPFINRNKNLFNIIQYIFVLSGLLLSVIMFTTSEFLINLWIPTDNSEIIKVVKILSPMPFLVSVKSTFGVNGLMVNNKDNIYMAIVIFGSLIGFAASIILIPKYFYIGGAISIILAMSIKAILAYVFNRKHQLSSKIQER